MSSGSLLPYQLRPNKAVDRELFLGLLVRLAPILRLEEYRYVGMGGPFLEDFRLIHSRLGIRDMVCIERDDAVHRRQLFNRPIQSIMCVHASIEEYVDETEFEQPIIIWFDYTEPRRWMTQIERFADAAMTLPLGSIIRITLNANPSSLGKPDRAAISVGFKRVSAEMSGKPTLQEWRLRRFRDCMGNLFPSGLGDEDMTRRSFGRSVLRALKLAVEKECLSRPDRAIVWALSTHYADGQPMVTSTIVVCAPGDNTAADIVEGWEFHSTSENPHVLDMPALSTLERLTMESAPDARDRLGYTLPESGMGEDPFLAFQKFYRVFPHFSRVDL